jgi:CCR4-NOT transcriptional regulation complex NOT5 subunit
LIDKAIALFDDLIEKIHAAKRKGGKEGFKPLSADLGKSIDGLQKELAKLG